jgi:DNA-binding response OmpR family regulator
MRPEPNIVIIADDDRDDSLFLLSVLLSMSRELTVISVPNGEKLINILETVTPHFIFLDINMPKKNGFDALKHIRSTKGSDQPTVIMCSTSGSANDIIRSQELGADMYITKPTSMKNFSKMIEDIFEKHWSGKANEKIPQKFLFSHVQ